MLLLVVSLFFQNCAEENKTQKNDVAIKEPSQLISKCPEFISKNKNNNLNISILLDLSDRIEDPKTKAKDSAYLSSLAKSFINHVKNKKVILLEDKMQLFFNPEPSDDKINDIAEKLRVSFTKQTTKSKLEETLKLYSEYPSKLYTLAQEDAKIANGYPGSDIWRFFKDNIKDYCIDDCHRNILVILTDGYMFYNKTIMEEKNKTSYLTPRSLKALKLNNSNWKESISKRELGFIPANKGLSDLEVLVIGVTSQNDENPYAQDVIEAYWSNWLESMDIKDYKIKYAGLPSNIEKVISDFIQN
tara:strand:- start:13654 stop:14559 length:906 start_codon:yes stop_codon:yes gene_type:complete